jgi:hypothetical protein
LPRLHDQVQLCVPARRFLPLFIGHTAVTYGNIVAVTCGNEIALVQCNNIVFTYGNLAAVTFCHDIRHSEPKRRGMLYADFAGCHVREVQPSGTNNRCHKRNPE